MKTKITFLTILFLFTSFIHLIAQNTLVEISGQIFDKVKKETLPAAVVLIKGTNNSASADAEGKFKIKTSLSFPFTLVVYLIGYEKQEFIVENNQSELRLTLNPQNILANEVVITASRIEEKLLTSPVAIDKLDIKAIRETPSPTFFDALENVKGVQLTTSSINFKVLNTRGFNTPNNFRFTQLVDGIDMQAATLGVPLGNAIGPNELDIRSVEITPGAASSIYGTNAINGLAHMQSKSPFLYHGLSLYQRTGINHINDQDKGLSFLSESSLRFADVLGKNKNWAYKLNFSYFQGIDWISSNTTDQNPYTANSANPGFPEFGNGAGNPSYDAWNKYGDENNNNIPIAVIYQGKNQTFNVRRTGYWEKDLISPLVKNLKYDASIHYKFPNEKVELSYAYRSGSINGVFQRGNKIQLNDAVVQNHKLQLTGEKLMVRSYVSFENTGKSYNLKPLADNLELTSSPNKEWGNIYRQELQNAIDKGIDLVSAHTQARNKADENRSLPGTNAFEQVKNTITGINNWDHGSLIAGAPATGGAALLQESRTYHTDLQYNLSKQTQPLFNTLIGGDIRVYEVIPDGNNFVDFSKAIEDRNTPGGKPLYYSKVGTFVQLTKTVLNEKLKFVGLGRYDYNNEFNGKWTYRIATVFSPARTHNIRLSHQKGYRFPSLFEALSFVNNGNVRRVGGLARVNKGLNYLNNSYTLASVNAFNTAVNADVAIGINKNEAALKNSPLLIIANLPTEQPEQVKSFDMGYKSVLADNTIVLDLDLYYNIFEGFLGQVEVAVPAKGPVGTDESILDMLDRSKQTRYRVFTNATNTYYNFGSALRLSYNFYKKFSLSGNISYNDLEAKKDNDIFITGFNTPKWSANIQFGNSEIVSHFGFNVVWKWQDTFLWQSPLATGNVGAYQAFDAQVSLKIPKAFTTVKIGGTNILNKTYIQYAAGPGIGALYYLSLMFDGLKLRKEE